MKKVVLIIIIVLVAVGGLATSKVLNQNNKNSETATTPSFDSPAAAAVDPCTVFDKAEIERLFAKKFAIGVASEQKEKTADNQPIVECQYRQMNDGTSSGLAGAYIITVTVENYKSAEGVRTQMDLTRGSAEKDGKVLFTVTDVSEIGDFAFFFTSEESLEKNSQESLHIAKSNQLFKLNVQKQSGIEHTVERQHLEKLANTKF